MEENKKEKKVDMWLSPSKISDFHRCPFYFFKTHIERVPIKKTAPLVKGNIIHDSIEKWFTGDFEKDLLKKMSFIFEREWRISPDLKELKLTKEEEKLEKGDCLNILRRFTAIHLDKMEALMDSSPPKAENVRHAWFLLRPHFNEVKLEDEDLKVRGRADRIYTNFDNIKILADYKTSNRYGIGITESQRQQVAIYALMYNKKNEKEPLNFVSIIFLRFGEEPMIEVTPSLIEYARKTILDVRGQTNSRDINDYPRKMSQLCAYCSLSGLCDGTDAYLAEKRMKKLKKAFKKKT